MSEFLNKNMTRREFLSEMFKLAEGAAATYVITSLPDLKIFGLP